MVTAVRLSLLLLAGPRYWLLPFVPLVWLGIQAALLLAGRPGVGPDAVQNALIGVPVAVLAVFLGGRVVAGELDEHTLEIAYTVPGGTYRIWLSKLAAAGVLLLASVALMAGATFVFFTPFPALQCLYGAIQGVAFYLFASMGFSTLFRSEVAGALASVALLGLNGLITQFGIVQVRVSPLWNPLAIDNIESERLLALAVQNRIGVALAIVAIMAMTFVRAGHRERMLGA